MQEKQNHLQGHLCGSFSVMVWGTTFVSTKVLLRALTPLEIMVARFGIGFLALLIVGRGLMRPPASLRSFLKHDFRLLQCRRQI